jgi:ATP-dependent DNA ligase
MPKIDSRLIFLDHLSAGGIELFDRVCQQDLEGVVAKWKHGCYETDGMSTSWIKIKNPDYSQWTGRRELFEKRRDLRQVRRASRIVPTFRLHGSNG